MTWPFDLTLIKDQAQVERAVSSEAEGKGTIPVESRIPRHNTHSSGVCPSVCLFFFSFRSHQHFISFFLTSFAVLSLSGRQTLN